MIIGVEGFIWFDRQLGVTADFWEWVSNMLHRRKLFKDLVKLQTNKMFEMELEQEPALFN